MQWIIFIIKQVENSQFTTCLNPPRNIPEGYEPPIGIEEILDCSVSTISGFKSDEERDSAMTRDSDFDIAFVKDDRWDSGTAQNIKRRHNI